MAVFKRQRKAFCLEIVSKPFLSGAKRKSELVMIRLGEGDFRIWRFCLLIYRGFPGGSVIKNLPSNEETRDQSLG